MKTEAKSKKTTAPKKSTNHRHPSREMHERLERHFMENLSPLWPDDQDPLASKKALNLVCMYLLGVTTPPLDLSAIVGARTMRDDLRKKLLLVLPHLRFAEEEARREAGANGKALFGVLVTKSDGTGKVLATFEAGELVEDLAKLMDAPPFTEEDRAEARAAQFLSKLGL